METAKTKQLGNGNCYHKKNLVMEQATTKQLGNGNCYNKTTW